MKIAVILTSILLIICGCSHQQETDSNLSNDEADSLSLEEILKSNSVRTNLSDHAEYFSVDIGGGTLKFSGGGAPQESANQKTVIEHYLVTGITFAVMVVEYEDGKLARATFAVGMPHSPPSAIIFINYM